MMDLVGGAPNPVRAGGPAIFCSNLTCNVGLPLFKGIEASPRRVPTRVPEGKGSTGFQAACTGRGLGTDNVFDLKLIVTLI